MGKIQVVPAGAKPTEAARIANEKEQMEQQEEAARNARQNQIGLVLQPLLGNFSFDHRHAMKILHQHVVQIALAAKIDRDQVVAWFDEAWAAEVEMREEQAEAKRVGLKQALREMMVQGLKIPPMIIGQINLLKPDLDPDVKEYIEKNSEPLPRPN